MRYPVIFQATSTGVSAYVPDLPGCVAAGTSQNEVRDLIAVAIGMHLNGMREDGTRIPEPSIVEIIEAR